MKKMKRIFAILLATVMIMGMATTTLAAETGTITVKDAVVGTTYSAYKIFDLVSYDAATGNYAYKVTDEWGLFFTDGVAGSKYVTVDDQGYVTTWVANADKVAFTNDAMGWVRARKINATATLTADSTEISFTNLDLGYYLVDSSLGALCSLTTTNPTAEITEKNTPVTVEKEVQEDSTEKWGTTNTAGVGEVDNFTATITVGKGLEKLIMHDRMTVGLTFQGVTGIELVKTDAEGVTTETAVAPANYTVHTDACTASLWGNDDEGNPYNCSFHVEFKDEYVKTLSEGDQLVVSYTAVVNENAQIGTGGEDNLVKIEYGTNHFTEQDMTTTYVYWIPVYKYYMDGETKAALARVGFTLYTDESCTESVNLYKPTGRAEYWACMGTCDEEHTHLTKNEIITDTTGKFEIDGLDAGTYYLKETTTPKGYTPLAAPVVVVIDDNGNVTADGVKVELGGIQIENKAGSLLPETGGMGTTLFYVLGTVLMLGAAIVLVTRKRMNNEQ